MQGRKILAVIISILALGLAFAYDKSISLFFASMSHLWVINSIMKAFTHIGSYIAVMLALLSFYLLKKNKAIIIPMWLSLGLSVVLAYALKYAVLRPRPPTALGIAALVAVGSYSFPSAHAASSFSLYPMISKNIKWLKYAWLAFAALVAFSRLYLGVHFLSDIIAGAILGCMSGWLVIALMKTERFKKLNFIARLKWI